MQINERTLAYGEIDHPYLGSIGIFASPIGIVQVKFVDSAAIHFGTRPKNDSLEAFLIISKAVTELGQYLAGTLTQPFQTPIDWSGVTDFQKEVLEKVSLIPYGSTCTYGDIARQVDQPHAARAVGHALAMNPFLVFIPCHRVLGNDHRLHGYAAPDGIKTKAWLLSLEGVATDKNLLTRSF